MKLLLDREAENYNYLYIVGTLATLQDIFYSKSEFKFTASIQKKLLLVCFQNRRNLIAFSAGFYDFSHEKKALIKIIMFIVITANHKRS